MKSVFVIVAVALLVAVQGQVESPGKPVTPSELKGSPAVTSMPVDTINFKLMLAEDMIAPKHAPGGQRFAYGFPVDLNLGNSGTWQTLADGGRVWRLQVVSHGANTLNFFLTKYVLLPGNQLFVYTPDRSFVRGAFTANNNKKNQQMAIAPIPGDSAVFELYVAPGAQVGELAIGIVNHDYHGNGVNTAAFGDSGACNINTICPIVDPYRTETRGVAMILTATGSRRCSGSMINNAREDRRQLFLTANHCLGGEANWIFMFNYQSPQCHLSDQSDGPTLYTVQGADLLENSAESDFAIMELTEGIPSVYNVTLNGYNAIDSPSVPFGIHHPSGDVMKYCYSENPTQSSQWSGVYRDTHWLVTEWHGPGTGPGNMGDRTTTEPGSSGSPLFDQNRRIIGQLHGGQATCSFPYNDYYGKVARSWTIGLADVLDPDNTGNLVLDSLDL